MKQLLTDPEGIISRGEFLQGFKAVVVLMVVSVGVYFGAVAATNAMPVRTVGMLPFLAVPLFFAIISTMYFAFCIYAKRLRWKGYSNAWVTVCLLSFFFAISARFTAGQLTNTGAAEGYSAEWIPLVLKILFVGFVALHVGLLLWMTMLSFSKDSEAGS